MASVHLVAAIALELVGTLALRAAATGRRAWYVLTLATYSLSFVFLSLALDAGMQLGVAYGIWAAVGVVLAACASRVLFHEPLSPLMGAGILLIAAGVLLVELGRPH